MITEDAIKELAAFRSQDAPVVSCYLDVDGRHHPRSQDVESGLDHLLRGARERWNGATATGDFQRIEEYVRGGFDRSRTRGLVIFSCVAHDLWRVVPLPVRVQSRIVVNAAPAVGQLESVVQELDRFGVLLVDRQRARMFVFQLGELVDRSELFEELPRSYDSRGHSDQGYDREQQHVEALTQQHLRHAADVAFHLFRAQGFEHLAIGAPQDLVPVLEANLHPYLRERLCSTIDVGVGAALDEVRTAAMEVESQQERRKEAAAVARLREEVGRKGRGVAGLDDTLQALTERRVEVLFVSQGFSETGWRCEHCDYICHRGPACPVDGKTMSYIDDVVEEAVDLALVQSCRVEVCVDNADLDVLGRIGALLRY